VPDDLERFEARCRPVIEMRRGEDGTWRGPPESAALLGDRGDVAARTPADLAGLVLRCWASGVDLLFLGDGSGGGVKGGAGAHAGAGPRRPDQSEIYAREHPDFFGTGLRRPDQAEHCASDELDDAAAELCKEIAEEHRRGP
jgi:hypothetical protein